MSQTRYRPIQMRAADDGAEGVLTGYAAIYENEYQVGPSMSEVIHRGAFSESLRQRDSVVPVFWNHGWAKTNAAPIGYAVLREDDKGLAVEKAQLFLDSEEGRRVYQATAAGALREWSVGFKANRIRRRGAVEGIESGDLVEVSVVIKGANRTEMTSVREADEADDDVDIIVEDEEEATGTETETESETEKNEEEADETQPPSTESETPDPDPAIVERAYGLLSNAAFREAARVMLQSDTPQE